MLLALLPLVAATVAFTEVAIDGEVSAADSRLSTAVAVAAADYREQLEDDAVDDAESLARATQVQRAFAERDRPTLLETAAECRTAPSSRRRASSSPVSGLGRTPPCAR